MESTQIEWTAADSDNTQKPGWWYAALVAGGVVIGAIVFWFTRDFIATGVVVVAIIALLVVGTRKARDTHYMLNTTGVSIGEHTHEYSEFRSFAIDFNATQPNVVLMPLKRFALGLTLYFNEEDAQKIIDHLSSILPMEDHHPDGLEKISRWIGL